MSSFGWTQPIHRLLHLLPPEEAHHLVISLLKKYQGFLRKQESIKGEIEIPGFPKLKLRNRLGLAAGFDKNAEVFPALATFGFGFLEVGTVTPLPQAGNPKPRIFRVDGNCLVNHLGFNNCGVEQFRHNLMRLKPFCGVPVFVNIGKGRATPLEESVEDYQIGFRHLSDVADAFVVNISSPNTPGLFSLQSMEFLDSIAKILPKHLPTWVKLSPDLSLEQIKEIAERVNQTQGLAGLVLTNTSRDLAANKNFDQGGLSGPPLIERSVPAVKAARSVLKTNKVIIGVGGVSSVEDAMRMRDAGADLVEVYTAFVYQGPTFIDELGRRLK